MEPKKKKRKKVTSTVTNTGPVTKEKAYNYMVQNAQLFRSEILQQLLAEGNRSIDSECGYPTAITTSDYVLMIARNGLADRVNSILPEECWAWTPNVVENEDSDSTDFEDEWEALVKDANVLTYLERIDNMSGIGRYGVLLMGFDDGMELNEPVEGVTEDPESRSGQERKLIYLKPFDESVIEIVNVEPDTKNPRFGQPTMYGITIDNTITNDKTQSVRLLVHWSRILHISDNRESSDQFGEPRLQNVFNYLLDVKKILGGSGEMFWKGGFPGYAFEVNPEYDGATMDTAGIKEEMVNYSQGLQRYLAISGVTAKSLAPQVADPSSHVTANVKLIALTKGVPYRIFLGSEEAKMASATDKQTWNTRIKKRQDKYLTPLVLRPFIDRLLQAGVLPEVEEYFVEWPDMNSPSDKDKADVNLSRTQALGEYVQKDVAVLVPPEEYMTIFLDMEPEEVKQITEASESYQLEKERLDEIEAEKNAAAGLDVDGNPIEEDDDE